MKKKIFAVAMAAVLTLSMVACGETQTNTELTPTTAPTETTAPTKAPDPTETPVPEAKNVTIEGASINFEDGNMGFADVYTQHATSAELELSIADFNGSKALKVVNKNNKSPWIAFDLASLLGADITKVAKVDMVIGTEYADGSFYATSGEVLSWWGTDLNETKLADWSVYMAKKNPKVITASIPAGCEFVADANNILLVSLRTDNGLTDTGASATIYIDDICFYDAAGNILAADSSVTFNAPEGFEKTGLDSNLLYLDNAVALDGFAVSAGGWTQAGIDLTDEQRALLVPGSVIEISYSCSEPVWLIAIGENNPLGGWLRGIEQNNFVSGGYVATDKKTVQYTYEQLVEFWGEDFGQYVSTLQCEGKDTWEVYSVKVGMASEFAHLGSATNIDGFAVSAGGWTQAGIDLTDEQRALFKPGSVIEISYSCSEPVWLIAIGENNPLGGWLRGIEQESFVTNGAVNEEGTVVQYTYEQLAEFWGDGFEQYLTTLQCEGRDTWEVYSVKVGKKMYPTTNTTSLDGFAVSAGGWTQAGIDLTDEQRALFKPGSVIEISYSCSEPVWLIAIGENNPLGGWLRGIEQESFVTNGAVNEEGTVVQYTYEQLAEFWGDGFEQYLTTLQCEGKDAWEVYGVTVGQAAATATVEKTDAPDAGTDEPAGEPTVDPLAADYAGDYGIGFTVSVDDLKAIDGDVTVTFDVATMTTYPNWQLCFVDYSDGWNKLATADFSANAPTFNDWGFADVTDGKMTVTLSKDAVAKIVANGGGLAAQVYGVVIKNVTVSTAAGTETTPAADAVTGTLSGSYVGDYQAEWIPANDFADFTNGAKFTINFRLQTEAEGRTNAWWNLTFVSGADGWAKYTDAKYYLGEAPAFSSYGFVAVDGTSYTVTLSPDALAQIKADGKFGIQTDGVIFESYSIEAVK